MGERGNKRMMLTRRELILSSFGFLIGREEKEHLILEARAEITSDYPRSGG